MNNELVIMGRIIGSHSGWDDGGGHSLIFYDFTASNAEIPFGSLFVDFETGIFEIYDPEDDGPNVLLHGDFIEIFGSCPKKAGT